ncbi:hypothetical protein BKA67DRAFT_532258 [Truncatella angustata]|uniref:Uncharacterized protein n=1 Tax=Truncatella angustata TaxID=152316 RepID=A0A9P8URR2_9PEZI|nr:uncharacterized protein BKA67DRAFT_532258 [Truncatella angustata]KAH6657024.1 hypothetical protein BKA67DRAFT_532258 [Truncatella angustata]
MESPNSSRGRGRFSARKRSTVPARSNSQRRSEPSEMPSSTPAAPVAPASTSFTFETPSPSNTRGTRMRTRNIDGTNASPEDATSKGGRSLRKRTRIDYSFDQDEEEQSIDAKPTPTTTRSLKKRKADPSSQYDDFGEDFEPAIKQRRTSELPSKPTVRRHTSRKSMIELSAFIADQPHDGIAVQDTIEVGGHRSQQFSAGSSQRRSSNISQKDIFSEQLTTEQPGLRAVFPMSSPQPVSSPISSIELTDEPETDIKSEVQEVSIPKLEMAAVSSTVSHQPEIEEPLEHLSASSPAPIVARSSPAPATKEDPEDPYSHLTPYISGANVYYPTLQATAVAPSTEPDGIADDTPVDEVLEDPNELPDDSTPAGSPAPVEDTAANSPAAEIGTPDVAAVIPKKQYPYKKLRPAQDFIDFIADYETLSPVELWARLEHLTGVLETIQNEHNDCRKLLDDEDNAVKYQQEESVFQHRVKLARSKDPNANPLRKEFVVKGIRAPRQDAMIEYAKQQDRVMANAYGFEYDDRDSKISQQDPIGQRGGIGKGRLRDRPKQTAKAAEAVDEGPVVHGKRTRKAPNLFGVGDVEPASRGSTPAPALPRKRRGRQAAEDNDVPGAVGETPIEESPKKRGRGGRPRKNPLSAVVLEDDHMLDLDAEAEMQEETRTSRKRRRRHVDDDEDFLTNGTNGQTHLGVGTRRRNSRLGLGEIPSGSFYSNASTQPNEESRPNTSSSTATASTSASAYGLREKRQKRFSLDDDEDGDFEDDEQPKPKRVRRVPKKVQEQDFANITPSNIPGNEPPVAVVPRVPRIRVKNSNPTALSASAQAAAPPSAAASLPPSGDSTPAQVANGDIFEENKDYGQLTKSEKMSMSMKARWASGSMSNAVAKRRATLAAKKAANQTPVPEGTPEVVLEQQGQA